MAANTTPNASYDVIVIGAGPGGYVAAIRAAQLGFKTAVVEKRAALGGTCLNIGCIPSKALLQVSHLFHLAGHSFAEMGITVPSPKLDLKKMMAHKDKVVADLTKGIEFLFKKNKITWHQGTGKITKAGEVAVTADKGKSETIAAKHILIATGSDVATLPGITVDEQQIVSSTGALSLSQVPKKLIIIGAGIIGLEMGSVWQRLGAQVEVIEYMDRITPGMDAETASQFQKILTKQGFRFHLGRKVVEAKKSKTGVTLKVEAAKGGAAEEMQADIVLMAVGRKPYTEGLGLKEAGVAIDDKGRVKVDAAFQTSVKGIYAIGDVIDGPLLAHKAEEEGVIWAEKLAGQKPHLDYNLIPGVVYTHPEVATIGATEEKLKADGVAYKVGKFPFLANSRARANADTEGFVKLLADAKTDKVLGCHIIGPEAGTLIHEIAAVMEFGGSSEDIARTCHAHPTLNEAIKEAALAVDSRAVHV